MSNKVKQSERVKRLLKKEKVVLKRKRTSKGEVEGDQEKETTDDYGWNEDEVTIIDFIMGLMLEEGYSVRISPFVFHKLTGEKKSNEGLSVITSGFVFMAIGEYLENVCFVGFEEMRKKKSESYLHTNGFHTCTFNFRGDQMMIELVEFDKYISVSSMDER
jgi:hypothetical protein